MDAIRSSNHATAAAGRDAAPAVDLAGVVAGVLAGILAGVFVVAMLAGCQLGGKGDVRVHNQQLRQENAALKAEIDSMQSRVEGLLTQLEAADQGDANTLGSQRLVLTQVRIGRYSTPMDTDGDGQDDTLKVDLTTHDQDGRPFAASAAVAVQLVALDQAGATLATLAAAEFDQAAFRAAYRAGFLGTQFVLKLPLDESIDKPEGLHAVEVRVALADAFTGATLTARRPVSVKW